MEKKDLQDIIKGCKKGDRNSQRMLFELYSDRMFAVCMYYSKNKVDAEDLLHTGFLKVFEKINQFKGTGPFEAWLRRIFMNTFLEKYRKSSKMFPVGDSTEFEYLESDEDIISKISSEDLIKLIQELSPVYRTVFNLYAIEGFSHKEIAEKLGIAEGTSKSNLARARKVLQEKVRGHFQLKETIIK